MSQLHERFSVAVALRLTQDSWDVFRFRGVEPKHFEHHFKDKQSQTQEFRQLAYKL